MKLLVGPGVAVAVVIVLSIVFTAALVDLREAALAGELRFAAPDFEASPEHAVTVPDFALPDRFGNVISLSRFSKLNLLVVNIWSTDCPVCRDEIPALTELDRQLTLTGDAALITIAVAPGWKEVAPIFSEGTNLRILFDGKNRVARDIFGTEKYPETFILDRQRRIRARFDGPRPWNTDTLLRFIQSY